MLKLTILGVIKMVDALNARAMDLEEQISKQVAELENCRSKRQRILEELNQKTDENIR